MFRMGETCSFALRPSQEVQSHTLQQPVLIAWRIQCRGEIPLCGAHRVPAKRCGAHTIDILCYHPGNQNMFGSEPLSCDAELV